MSLTARALYVYRQLQRRKKKKITQNQNAESSFAIVNEQAVLPSYVSWLLIVYTQPQQMDRTDLSDLFFINEGSALSELVT